MLDTCHFLEVDVIIVYPGIIFFLLLHPKL